MAEQIGRKQLVVKLEAVAGTAETLESGAGLAANAVMLMADDIVWDPDFKQTERAALTSSFSNRGTVVGGASVKLTFKANLRGTSGAFADPANMPDLTLPLRACGCTVVQSGGGGSEIVTVTPTDVISGWYTFGMYMGGKVHRLAGGAGNCKVTFENRAPVMAEFEIMGVYVAPTDVAFRTSGLASGSPIPPPYLAAATSILSYATPLIKSMTLDFGNRIVLEEDPNGAFGLYRANLADRSPKGTIDPESAAVGTKNYWNELLAGSTGSITTGTFPSSGTQYNKLNLTQPNCQYEKAPYGDRDGLGIHQIEYVPRANSSAGADDWTIVLS